jgi:hypothetical protein
MDAEGKIIWCGEFRHGCVRHPVMRPVVVLCSEDCANQWLTEYPSYIKSYLEFMNERNAVNYWKEE